MLVVAGGTEVPGSALLAGIGALRAGAGRLQIATCARNATALGIAIPEALVLGVPETSAGDIDPTAAVQLMPYVSVMLFWLDGREHQTLGRRTLKKTAAAPVQAGGPRTRRGSGCLEGPPRMHRPPTLDAADTAAHGGWRAASRRTVERSAKLALEPGSGCGVAVNGGLVEMAGSPHAEKVTEGLDL